MFKNKGIWIGLAIVVVLLGILLLDVSTDDDSQLNTESVNDEVLEAPEPVDLGNSTFYEDIVYVETEPNSRHKMDVYVPKGFAGQRPLLIWIHGGGWIDGDKADPPILNMLDEGFVVASVNYRLSPTYLHPQQVHDVKAAVRYLKARGSLFGIDEQRVVLVGHSAGAHLASYAGLTDGLDYAEDLEQGNGQTSSAVQAVVASAPPIDFTTFIDQAKQLGLTNSELVPGSVSIDDVTPEVLLTGCTIDECGKQVDLTNPIFDIDASDPPFFIQHSEDDNVVPYLQGRQLHEALLEANVDSTFNRMNDRVHDFVFTAQMKNWILEKLEQNG